VIHCQYNAGHDIGGEESEFKRLPKAGAGEEDLREKKIKRGNNKTPTGGKKTSNKILGKNAGVA